MSKKFKRFFAGLLAFVLVFAMTAVAAPAKEVKAAADGTETVAIGAEVGYTGLTTPGYTFDSSSLTAGKTVGAMVFNITVNLPAEGDVAWNDWCGEALAVHANGETKYYDFGGAQVGWGVDMTGDEVADTTGVGSASWTGSVSSARTLTVTVPVNADTFTIDFFDNCWDSATDIPHYTIHSGTAIYGTVAATETVAIGHEVGYTGLTTSGYTFDSSVLTTEGTAAMAVFNISISLPTEGDVAWNDWCGEAAKVTVGDKVNYYDFGGAQVGWGVDMTGDEVADTAGVGSASWAGSAENRSVSAVFPIGGEDFTIDFYDNCWDSATDITHYVINSATILYGTTEGGAEEPAGKVVVETPETVAVGAEVSYTGLTTPGYTFDSSSLTKGGKVGAMVFNITVNLPAEGDVAWNDWCGEALAVHANDETKYYDFGGAQVGWGVDMTGDEVADTTGVGTASWVGSVTSSRNLTVTVPVNAETFTIDFFDNCWDSATDIPHYTIHSATAVYGDVAASENVAVGQEVKYTGLTTSGYTFDSSCLTTEGTAAYAVFNINIALPTEGDVAWNDWCGEAAKVTIGDTVNYYDFGGAQVGWGVDMTGDEVADTTGVGSASWAGSAENRSVSAVFPIGAEDFTIDFYDNCWDSATDITHYVINSATILYGTAASTTVQEEEDTTQSTVNVVELPDEFPIFVAIGASSDATEAWDLSYGGDEANAGEIIATSDMISVGETVTVGLVMPLEVYKTHWMAPVLVAEGVGSMDVTVNSITLDGEDVLAGGDVDLDADSRGMWWYETSGIYNENEAIRIAGGYNQYHSETHFEASPAGWTEVYYTITLNSISPVAPTISNEIVYDGEFDVFLGSHADVAEMYDWGYMWTNSGSDTANVTGNVVKAKAGETVTVGLTFENPVFHVNWLAPAIVLPEEEEGKDKYKVDYTLNKVVVDGVDVTDKVDLTLGDAFWYEGADNHASTRMIRLAGGYDDYKAQYLAGDVLTGFKTIEYTITINKIYGEVVTEVEEGPKVDKNGTYNVYFGIQSQNWSFRNAWDDATYGLNSADYPEAFGQMGLVDSTEGYIKKAGTFKDAVITGNGTYSVELNDIAWDDGSTALNLLFLSTDIPNSGEITFSNIKVDFDGKNVMDFAEGFIDPDSKEWLKILFINIWNKDLTSNYPMADTIANSNIKITFDVSGFDYDNTATEPEVTPEPTAAPTEAPTKAPEPTVAPTEAPEPTVAPTEAPAVDADAEAEGGAFPVGIIVIVAIVIAAGAGFVVMKKKK